MTRKSREQKKTYRPLTPDQLRFNKIAKSKKGRPGSVPYKRYIFGHQTNVRKGKV